MYKVLVIRLSAIGDVAMTIPVVYDVAEANPQDSFYVLTQEFLLPLFINRPSNVHLLGMNTQSTERSLWRLIRYIFRLRRHKFDMALDLHNVIRSWMIDFLFYMSGKKVFRIDKGRKERKRLTRRPPKIIDPLRQTTERYADVFQAAGFHYEKKLVSLYDKNPVDEKLIEIMAGDRTGNWVGIAPFAKHKGKVYPIEKMVKVVEQLSEQGNVTLFLWGGRGEEADILERWATKYKNTVNMAGRYPIDMELALLNRLDALVSMDSANMHLSSLVGGRVISVWGATHPYAGFYGYCQRDDLAIQVDLPCRPCSIYGNKPCYRGDWACMQQILPEQITEKINKFLREK